MRIGIYVYIVTGSQKTIYIYRYIYIYLHNFQLFDSQWRLYEVSNIETFSVSNLFVVEMMSLCSDVRFDNAVVDQCIFSIELK